MKTKITFRMNSIYRVSKLMVLVTCLFVSKSVFGQFAAGTGTVSDPYQITTKDELFAVPAEPTASFKLMNNLDLTGELWEPIGDDLNKFTGNFDGNAKKVSNVAVSAGSDNRGFFGVVSGAAEIKNLFIENITANSGNSYIGGIVGKIEGGTIKNCAVKGTLIADGGFYSGGIVGGALATSPVMIQNCIFDGTVSSFFASGGIMGMCDTQTTIQNCIASGEVKAAGRCGGVLGFCGNEAAVQQNTIKNNVLTNLTVIRTVDWSGEEHFHRIIGTFDNTKANVLDKNMSATTVNITGLSSPRNFTSENAGPEGLTKTVSELQTQSVYEGANYVFGNSEAAPWGISANSYPSLWFAPEMIKTGVNNISSISVGIYPNPCKSGFNVKSDAVVKQIDIYSVSGCLLNRVKDASSIDVSMLSPNVYLVKIVTEDGTDIQKLTKE